MAQFRGARRLWPTSAFLYLRAIRFEAVKIFSTRERFRLNVIIKEKKKKKKKGKKRFPMSNGNSLAEDRSTISWNQKIRFNELTSFGCNDETPIASITSIIFSRKVNETRVDGMRKKLGNTKISLFLLWFSFSY